nr:photosystem I subunit VIII [Rhododendron przewalskii subsp. przewalskii]WEG23332.1 photosystem I subunit VIII [Rhododendron przewalskii subsp. przewalskii]
MITFNFPCIFVPLVGLVFPAIAMASLSLHIQKTRLFKFDRTKSHLFFQNLDLYPNTNIYLVEYGIPCDCGFCRT